MLENYAMISFNSSKKKNNYLGMYHQSKCKVFNSERSLMLCVHALNRSIGEEVHVL